MTITDVNKTNDTYSDRIESGTLKVRYVETYELITDDPNTDTTITAGSHPLLPARGTELVTANGFAVWVQSVDCNRTERLKFEATVTYTNETENWPTDSQGLPTNEPSEVAKRIEITSEEIQIPITNAAYEGVFDEEDNFWVNIPGFTGGEKGPIINSALTKIERFKPSHRDVIKVTDWRRTWQNAWDDFQGSGNDADITFTLSDADGPRMTKTYLKETLKCQSVVPTNVWKKGQLWFKRTMIFRHYPDGLLHKEPDYGLVERDFVADAIDGITTQDGAGFISEPSKLNGEGKAFPTAVGAGLNYDDTNTFYVHFHVVDYKDHQELIDGTDGKT